LASAAGAGVLGYGGDITVGVYYLHNYTVALPGISMIVSILLEYQQFPSLWMIL
jgi:hypothetical protein